MYSNAENFTISLKAARVNKGLSRKEVCKATGISDVVLGYYERGEMEPGGIALQKLLVLYGVGIEMIRFDQKLLEKKKRGRSPAEESAAG